MSKRVLYIIIILINFEIIFCQSSDNQRINNVITSEFEININSSLSITGTDHNLYLHPKQSISILVHSINFEISLPESIIFSTKFIDPSKTLYGFNDPEISLSYDIDINDNILNLNISSSFPLNISNPYSQELGILNNGYGLYNITLGTDYIIYIDPVSLFTSFSWNFGIPKNNNNNSAFKPGKLSLKLGYTEVLNSNFGYSIITIQNINLFNNKDAYIQNKAYSYSLIFYSCVFVSFNSWILSFNIDKELTINDNYPTFSLNYTYIINGEK